jgi:drug/metabolite transporter (DMT)-like permease
MTPLATLEYRARVALWVLPVLWAVNMWTARVAADWVSPHVLALGRWGMALAVLVALAWAELWRHRAVLQQHAWRYVIMGACGMWICGAWIYLAGQSTQAINISLIYSSAPVLIALGARLWLGERMRPLQWLGVIAAFGGVLHVILKGQWATLTTLQLVAGDLWVAAAALAWAVYALLQKRWLGVLGPTAQLAAIAAGGVLVLLPFALWELTLAHTPPVGAMAWGLMVVNRLGAWFGGLLAVRVGAARVGGEPNRRGVVPWAFVHSAHGLADAGRAARLVSPGRWCVDFGWCGAGYAARAEPLVCTVGCAARRPLAKWVCTACVAWLGSRAISASTIAWCSANDSRSRPERNSE